MAKGLLNKIWYGARGAWRAVRENRAQRAAIPRWIRKIQEDAQLNPVRNKEPAASPPHTPIPTPPVAAKAIEPPGKPESPEVTAALREVRSEISPAQAANQPVANEAPAPAPHPAAATQARAEARGTATGRRVWTYEETAAFDLQRGRKPRTREEWERIQEFQNSIGQALVDNLNRNVLATISSTDQRAHNKVARVVNIEPPHLSPVIAAAAFAAQKHRDQRRKGAEASPYINHPIAVANVLANEAGITDVVVLTAALLHDTVEDTETAVEEISRQFGADVASVVAEVTDDKSLPKAERKARQILHAADLSDRAKLVKLADKICNLRDLGASPPADWSQDRLQEYFDWACKVIDALKGVSPRLEALFDVEYAKRPGGEHASGSGPDPE